MIITKLDYFEDLNTALGCVDMYGEISTDYYFNQFRKIDYNKYNKIYILDNPGFDFYGYVLKHVGYSGHNINSRRQFELVEKNDIIKFKNHDKNIFGRICDSTILGELYQAVLRVARDSDKNCEVFILTNHDNIYYNLLKLLPGSKTGIAERKIKTQREKRSLELISDFNLSQYYTI